MSASALWVLEVYVIGISDVRSCLSESVRLVKFGVFAYLGCCGALIGRFGAVKYGTR